MELGEKIRAARLEAGLSQRQLCGEHMTRNMLSLIENGAARPSMATLRYLAEQLGKPVSYFLEEQAVTSPNQACMEAARSQWQAGDPSAVLETLSAFRQPDGVFENERGLLRFLSLLALAEQALAEDRQPYARALLEKAAAESSSYITAPLRHRQRVLQAGTGESVSLGDDDTLLARAQLALRAGDPERCMTVLRAADDRNAPRWQLLCGQACFTAKNYAPAAIHLAAAEADFPRQTVPSLEICYRELKDFQRAYEYACKARELGI